MKKSHYLLISISMLVSFNFCAWAGNAKTLGLGITLGDPTGPTLKYWTSEQNAFDVGIGFQRDTIIYADYLWHVWDIFEEVEKGIFGGYIGIGGRIEKRKKDDKIGIRTTAGIDYFFDKHPVELFFELAPIFQIEPDTDTEFDVFVGVRFYINNGK